MGLRFVAFVVIAIGLLVVSTSPGYSDTSDGPWEVGTRLTQGKPMFIRINKGLKASDPKYPYRAVSP